MPILYIVATPIGNLEDMTFRAMRILKEVDLILCENTSNAQKLLKHYEINTKTSVYFSQSKLKQTEKILKLFEEGKSVALISDAGTPGISDPGALLISEIKKYFNNEVKIVPIPGASAITALFSVSGVFGNEFSFLGFVPQKKGRETFIKNIFEEIKLRPIVFYESVHRIMKLLESLSYFANKNNFEDNNIIIGRELTKMNEEVFSGSFSEALEYFKNNTDHVRGEFVIIVYKEK